MQTLSALCNAPVVGLQALACDGSNFTQRDEMLEVNKMRNTLVMLQCHTLILLALFVGGCASVGETFPYQEYKSLELGKTSSEDYRTIFGNPLSVNTKDTEDGKIELATYVYGAANIGSARSRALGLEFKDGLLNSYIYISSFEEEESILDAAKLEQIERGVSTREHAVKTLGEPNGIAKCPSQLPDFKDRCESVMEVYAWTLMERLSTFGAAFGGDQVQSQTVFLGFNNDGIVDRVELVRSNTGADEK